MNYKKMTARQLFEEYRREFENDNLSNRTPCVVEINRRNRARLFKDACRFLKLRYAGGEQFMWAACYADAVIGDDNYNEMRIDWEMKPHETKQGFPILIDLLYRDALAEGFEWDTNKEEGGIS